MKYEWVIGSFTGDQAKIVKSHADAGIGYYIQQENGAGFGHTVVAAFRRAISEVRPEHLMLASPYQQERLNKLHESRFGAVYTRKQEATSVHSQLMRSTRFDKPDAVLQVQS